MIVYINGAYLPLEQARISPEDRGFLFADAIYEVARFFRGRAFHLGEHLSRMGEGLSALQIPADPAFYPEVSERLLAENDLLGSDAIVYAQISRGAAPRFHGFPPLETKPTVFAFARASDAPAVVPGGRAVLLPDERWGRCDIKTVMLLPNVLAFQKAKEAGAMEAILVRDGVAWEATKANLFLVRGGVVQTAPNGPRILPGVTRAAAIDAARGLGYSVQERAFSVSELLGADEVFLASTTLWTQAVTEIEGQTIGTGQPGPVGARIRDVLREGFTKA